jgi:hypothetical protein
VDWEFAWSLQQLLGGLQTWRFSFEAKLFRGWRPLSLGASQTEWSVVVGRPEGVAEADGISWKSGSVQAPLGVVDLHAWLSLRCSALLCAAACSPETTLLWSWPACCCSGARVSTSFPWSTEISSSETGSLLRAADVGCVLEQTGCG